MRYPSIFISTATRMDPLGGVPIMVMYHPDGSVTSRWGDTPIKDVDDPGLTHAAWIKWMTQNGYTVVTRDATYEEIQKGKAL